MPNLNKLTEPQKKYIELRAIKGKSINTIAKKLNIDIDQLKNWEFELEDEIREAKALEYDRLLEKYELAYMQRIEYLGNLYVRLKNEVDKRDFSGLPTDKLYFILMDVKDRMKQATPEKEEDLDFDNFDNFDDLDDLNNKF